MVVQPACYYVLCLSRPNSYCLGIISLSATQVREEPHRMSLMGHKYIQNNSVSLSSQLTTNIPGRNCSRMTLCGISRSFCLKSYIISISKGYLEDCIIYNRLFNRSSYLEIPYPMD